MVHFAIVLYITPLLRIINRYMYDDVTADWKHL